MFTAFCYQEGDVHFGEEVPGGGLLICYGRERDVRKVIEDNCVTGAFADGEHPMIECVSLSFNDDPSVAAHVDVLIDWIIDIKHEYLERPLIFSH